MARQHDVYDDVGMIPQRRLNSPEQGPECRLRASVSTPMRNPSVFSLPLHIIASLSDRVPALPVLHESVV
jgi:hypothetical protein